MKINHLLGVAVTALLLATQLLSSGPAFADKADNILRVGVSDEAVSLDPATGSLGSEMPYNYSLYDRLIDLVPNTLALKPMLATSWDWSPDKLTMTLHLRQGVKFHDGTIMDAAAVKASLEYFKSTRISHDLDPVTSIEVIDPQTVALHLSGPYSALPAILADRAGMIESPTGLQKYGKDFTRHAIGTGPFMLTDWESGRIISMRRFPDYWDKGNPKLDGIDFHIITNTTSIVAALQNGQIDYAAGIDSVNYPVLKKNPKLVTKIEPTVAWGMLNLNTKMAPIDDKRVRQALALSVDRQALANAVYGPGMGAKPASLPYPPDFWTNTKSVENAFTYDPKRARQLLAEAGHPDGVDFPICAPAVGLIPGKMIGEVLQQQMKPAGFNLDVKVVATTGACAQMFNTHSVPAFTVSWTGRPDPYMTYSQMFGSKGPYNTAQTDYGADATLDAILKTSDQKEQKPLYDKLNQMWVDQVPVLPLFYWVYVVSYSKDLDNEQPSLLARANVRNLYFKK